MLSYLQLETDGKFKKVKTHLCTQQTLQGPAFISWSLPLCNFLKIDAGIRS